MLNALDVVQTQSFCMWSSPYSHTGTRAGRNPPCASAWTSLYRVNVFLINHISLYLVFCTAVYTRKRVLWTSDQHVAETSTWQHTQHSQWTTIHAPGGIRTRNPGKRSGVDTRLRPLGHWDRHCTCSCTSLSWTGIAYRNELDYKHSYFQALDSIK